MDAIQIHGAHYKLWKSDIRMWTIGPRSCFVIPGDRCDRCLLEQGCSVPVSLFLARTAAGSLLRCRDRQPEPTRSPPSNVWISGSRPSRPPITTFLDDAIAVAASLRRTTLQRPAPDPGDDQNRPTTKRSFSMPPRREDQCSFESSARVAAQVISCRVDLISPVGRGRDNTGILDRNACK